MPLSIEADRRSKGSSARWLTIAAIVALLGAAAIYLIIEGDLAENFVDLRDWFRGILRHFGAPGSLALLYIEESGVPLPVPGDVYVIYLGHLAAGYWPRLLGYWLAIIGIVVAGSTNLYWISRRWGVKLIEHPLVRVVHLEPARLEKAQAWFDRWGVLAVIFGRHIPGFRVPLTLVAGTLKFPYRLGGSLDRDLGRVLPPDRGQAGRGDRPLHWPQHLGLCGRNGPPVRRARLPRLASPTGAGRSTEGDRQLG